MVLPASARSSFWANSINLAAGTSLNVNQAEANGQLLLSINTGSTGAPTNLNLTAGDVITTHTFDNPLTAWSTAANLSAAPLITSASTSAAETL